MANIYVPPLPATRDEFRANRAVKQLPNLNDTVEQIIDLVWENPDYTRLLTAVEDGSAVEGSLVADDYAAARFLRDYAKENNFPSVAHEKLHAIKLAQSVVLRRYKLTRKLRKFTPRA